MPNFYQDKRIIVTGGAGFLGQHLVKMLQEAGAVVFVPRSKEYDLRLRFGGIAMMQSRNAEIIFHLAARVSGIANTFATPANHIYDNAMMALLVIRECAERNTKLVMAGSVCAYPEHTPVPMIEENLWNGAPEPTNASYGEAKRLALSQHCKPTTSQHGLRCAYLLSANLYGPGDNFNPQTSHVIPALIRKVDTAQRNGDAGIAVWGSGHATRDFLCVEDAARAYMLAGELVDTPEPINIGSGEEIYIAALVEKVKTAMNFQGDTVFNRSKPDGQSAAACVSARQRSG